MSASIANPGLAGARLGFGRILDSEWIKLRTLRSTWWCSALIVVLGLLFGLLLASTVNSGGETLPAARQEGLAVQVVTLGVNFTQLIAAVLGVLVISGEYGTGMIRSTFAAVPARLPAILAKLAVLAVTTFVAGLLSVVLTVLVTTGLLAAHGISPDLGRAAVWMPMVGSALYLALIAVLAFTIGTVLRNTAGGIATALGLILVVPIVLGIASGLTQAKWIANVAAVLPSSAGAELSTYAAPGRAAEAGVLVLNGWGGLLVLLAWIVAVGAAALVLVKRRDA